MHRLAGQAPTVTTVVDLAALPAPLLAIPHPPSTPSTPTNRGSSSSSSNTSVTSTPLPSQPPSNPPPRRPTSQLTQALQSAATHRAPSPHPMALTQAPSAPAQPPTLPTRPTTPLPIPVTSKPKQLSRPVPVPPPEPRRRTSLHVEPPPPPPGVHLPSQPRRSLDIPIAPSRRRGPQAAQGAQGPAAAAPGPQQRCPPQHLRCSDHLTDDVDLDIEAEAEVEPIEALARRAAMSGRGRRGVASTEPADPTVRHHQRSVSTSGAARAPAAAMEGPKARVLPLEPDGAGEDEGGSSRRRRTLAITGDWTVRGAGLYEQYLHQQRPDVNVGRGTAARPAFRSEPINARVIASSPEDASPPSCRSPSPSPPSPSTSRRTPPPATRLCNSSSLRLSSSRNCSVNSLSSSCGAIGDACLRQPQPDTRPVSGAEAVSQEQEQQQQAHSLQHVLQQHVQPRTPQQLSQLHAALGQQPLQQQHRQQQQPPQQPPQQPQQQPQQQQSQAPQLRAAGSSPQLFALDSQLPAYVQQILAGGAEALQHRAAKHGGLAVRQQQQRAAPPGRSAGWPQRTVLGSGGSMGWHIGGAVEGVEACGPIRAGGTREGAVAMLAGRPIDIGSKGRATTTPAGTEAVQSPVHSAASAYSLSAAAAASSSLAAASSQAAAARRSSFSSAALSSFPAGSHGSYGAAAASSLAAVAQQGSYGDLMRGAMSRHNSQSWGQQFLVGSTDSTVLA